MIDIHSHILPGIDDGPGSMDETLEMAWAYERAGFDTVIATPHHIPGTSWNVSPETVRKLVVHVNRILVLEGIRVRALPGMEVGLASEVPRLLSEKALLTLAGSPYVLLETPFQRLPLNWEQTVFELTAMGYKVVWAHPERCGQLQNAPEQARRMVQVGCFFQVNWGSILGHNGSDTGDFAREMIRRGWVHCMATDSHDAVSRKPGNASTGMRALEDTSGQEGAALLAYENPDRILKSKALNPVAITDEAPPEGPVGIRRFFPWKR